MIAVRPPDYLPQLAYVALMDAVDVFVLADTFQYSRQSFQNRARLRTPQGWQWLSVPLRGGQHGMPICDVAVEGPDYWTRKHWRSFEYNYRTTPFFEFFESDLRPLYDRRWTHLGELTCAGVAVLHRLFGLSCRLVRASELPGRPDTLPAVTAALEATELLVPAAAAAHDRRLVAPLHVMHFETPVYRQNFEGFEPDLSALDLLFNYGPEARTLLRQGVQAVEVWPGAQATSE